MKLNIASALFAAAVTCSSGYAQTSHAIANIPFDFHVGDTAMPAGKYQLDENGVVLQLKQPNGRHSILHTTAPATTLTMASQNTVRFARYGNEYYLTSFWNGDSPYGRSLGSTKHQKFLAQQFKAADSTSLALNRSPR